MSLDKQIKEMAEKRVDEIVVAAARAVANVIGDSPVGVRQIARLVSEHKTQTTKTACVKAFSDQISADMLKSMSSNNDD